MKHEPQAHLPARPSFAAPRVLIVAETPVSAKVAPPPCDHP